jgi:hypothetical protein
VCESSVPTCCRLDLLFRAEFATHLSLSAAIPARSMVITHARKQQVPFTCIVVRNSMLHLLCHCATRTIEPSVKLTLSSPNSKLPGPLRSIVPQRSWGMVPCTQRQTRSQQREHLSAQHHGVLDHTWLERKQRSAPRCAGADTQRNRSYVQLGASVAKSPCLAASTTHVMHLL